MKYLLYGDSIAWGMGDYKKRGWAGRLKKHVHSKEKKKLSQINKNKQGLFKKLHHNINIKRKNYFFKNYSIPGYTSRNLLKIFEKKIKKQIKKRINEEFSIIIAIGTNDSKLDLLHPDKRISETEFKNNIIKLIKLSKKFSENIIILGLLPVYEHKTTPFIKKTYYYNNKIKKYNIILHKCAIKEKVKFIDFYDAWIKKNLKELFSDGLHPNIKGHTQIFNEIKSIF